MDKKLEASVEDGFVYRIAVVRALAGLGDMLCVVPALRALRAAFPSAQINLVGLATAYPFVERFSHYVDGLLEFPGYPGLQEVKPKAAQVNGFLAEAQRRRFDLAIQLHGSGVITNPLTLLLGAKLNAGCYLAGQYCPDERFFLGYPENEPEIWRTLRLLEFLNIPLRGDYLEFPLENADIAALHQLEEARTLEPGRYVCLHPGASTSAKRWTPEGFAAVGDFLTGQGFKIVLTGSREELELARQVQRIMREPAINLAGKTSLGALAALLNGARLLICNDTGVSHLADALRVPSVVIFTNAETLRWAPLDRELHRVVHYRVECSPCANSVCPIDHPCATSVTPQMVLLQANQLLRKGKINAA